MVQQFLNTDGSWNILELKKFFHVELVRLILQVKVHVDLGGDQLELRCQHSGKSLTAMAYEEKLKKKINDDDDGFSKWLRSLKLYPRVELFWWRLSKSAIPTNLFLMKRGLLLDSSCPRGCNQEENYNHVMAQCTALHKVLQKLRDWGFTVPLFNNLDSCLKELRRLSVDHGNIVKMYCITVFLSWKNRNEVKHGKQPIDTSMVASNVLSLFKINNTPILDCWGANLLRESLNSWHPPPLDWIKVNVDASLLRTNLAGIGGVFRDHKGRLIMAFGRNMFHWDVAQLEMEAVVSLQEYIQDWMLECKGLIIEGDNLNIIKFIQSYLNKKKWCSDKWLDNNLFFLKDFNKVIFHHVHRDCNKVADCCATLALENNFCFDSSSFINIPSSLFSLLKKECDPFLVIS
ncbi:hypothetical protein M5K25_022448 [Dendrobium thyrsiflorum]|uniref:RNase H type-1 domain-containing protein n=1 Tax=Dendrobium thyrsiflorum TaxID=117978 RepID=A0ABD0U698_DENTH